MNLAAGPQVVMPQVHEFPASQDAQSDIGDGSSSLSDIENNEVDQEDLDGLGSEDELEEDPEQYDEEEGDVDVDSDANDSEAETERLENSPHVARRHKDVLLDSQAESRTYERSPSKLHQSYAVDEEAEEFSEEEEDEDEEDDDDEEAGSGAESAKSFTNRHIRHNSSIMGGGVFEEPSSDQQEVAGRGTSFSKKRKRSLLPERRTSYPEDLEEPARKRTGSISARNGDEFAIDDTASGNDDLGASNTISGELSEADSDLEEDEQQRDEEMPDQPPEERTTKEAAQKSIEHTVTKEDRQRRSRSRKSLGADEAVPHLDGPAGGKGLVEDTLDQEAEEEEEEDHDVEAENEVDEAEIALKNEEEQEKKRLSLDLLGDIQRQFDKFKNTLYIERMAQLEREEIMLRADPPTHPQYLEMMKCIDARHDDRLKNEAILTKYKLGGIQRTAVAKRSQVLAQFHQEVRDIRERTLEKCGKTWYDIQSDRRGYGSQVENYGLQFPTKRSTQIQHHNQYTKEVSLLSGIAKNVGFPAAPNMNGASREELESDLERMGKQYQQRQVTHRANQALPDYAAIRAAASTSSYKPAEEQFIEQTPWANPQHPSHAHLIQRQSSNHQAARNGSPFAVGVGGIRRQPQPSTTPVLGLFSGGGTGGQSHTQPTKARGSRVSSMNPFTSSLHQQKAAPSQVLNRQRSKSPRDRPAEYSDGNNGQSGATQKLSLTDATQPPSAKIVHMGVERD